MKTLCWGYGIGLVFGQSGIQGDFIKKTLKGERIGVSGFPGFAFKIFWDPGLKRKYFRDPRK